MLMIKLFFKVFIPLCFLMLFPGCANQVYSFSYSPINLEYSKELNKLKLGMSKEEVVKILPNLIPRGQTYVEREVVEAQELQHNYWTGVGGKSIHELMWFYFHNDLLVKWGKANDWPAKPDLIIEHRIETMN